jgi:chemotaxis protein CheC
MEMTTTHIDALKELINIGVGKAANILNTLVGSHIGLQVPDVMSMPSEDLFKLIRLHDNEKLASVDLPFKGQLFGTAKLIFPTDSAAKLVKVFTSEEDTDDDFDALRAGTLAEIGNIVLNSLIGTVSNMLELKLTYSTPEFIEGNAGILLAKEIESNKTYNIFARTSFKVFDLEIKGDFVLLLEFGSFENLITLLDQFSE